MLSSDETLVFTTLACPNFGPSLGDERYRMPDTNNKQEQLYTVKPSHVILLGAGILGSGILLTGSLSYRQAGKQLATEGLDASIRRRILPHAVKALGGSLLLTGAAAAGCFHLMQSLGLVNPDAPTSSSALTTAWHMMLRPQAAATQQAQADAQAQQGVPVSATQQRKEG